MKHMALKIESKSALGSSSKTEYRSIGSHSASK